MAIGTDINAPFVNFTKIDGGLSGDLIYRAENSDGLRVLLRFSDADEYGRKKAEYDAAERAYAAGILTPRPIGIGAAGGGRYVYSLRGWIEGADAVEVLPRMSEAERYLCGVKAGKLLRALHALPAPSRAEPWRDFFYKKVRGRIDFYNANPLRADGGDTIVRYLINNKSVLDGRPQTFIHGDFNTTNILITPNNQIAVIDFNRYDGESGDPWGEFAALDWGAEPYAHFQTGLINGYFDDKPPESFFGALAYYLAYDALAALCDTHLNIQGGSDIGKRHVDNVLRWLDNMERAAPSWYIKNFCAQEIDGVPFKLLEPFDFSFVKKYGAVFKVFDEQGVNFCFGADGGPRRFFIKFAGALPVNIVHCGGDAAFAVECLKNAAQVYRDLEHPSLINFLYAEEVGGGYAAVFEWTDAVGIEPFNSDDYRRFCKLPADKKIRAFEDIMAFHAHVAAKGYVALDFYDGSVMYDYAADRVVICDVDFYRKAPYVGDLGRWGSARFVSPEETRDGAAMDEITNVYTMGATAFSLFARGDRSPDAWPLNKKTYGAVKKAVSEERDDRQRSIRQLIDEWNAAKA